MRIFFFVLNFFVTCVIVSCSNGNVAKFKITNLNSTPVDSVYFEPGNKSDRIFITVSPNKTLEYMLNMRGIHSNGAYGMYYKQNNEWKKRIFGYYSKGYASEKMTEIKILPDTVTIKQIY